MKVLVTIKKFTEISKFYLLPNAQQDSKGFFWLKVSLQALIVSLTIALLFLLLFSFSYTTTVKVSLVAVILITMIIQILVPRYIENLFPIFLLVLLLASLLVIFGKILNMHTNEYGQIAKLALLGFCVSYTLYVAHSIYKKTTPRTILAVVFPFSIVAYLALSSYFQSSMLSTFVKHDQAKLVKAYVNIFGESSTRKFVTINTEYGEIEMNLADIACLFNAQSVVPLIRIYGLQVSNNYCTNFYASRFIHYNEPQSLDVLAKMFSTITPTHRANSNYPQLLPPIAIAASLCDYRSYKFLELLMHYQALVNVETSKNGNIQSPLDIALNNKCDNNAAILQKHGGLRIQTQ